MKANDDLKDQEADAQRPENSGRREFLTKSSLLVALVGLGACKSTGLTGAGLDREEQVRALAVNRVVDEAIESGDIQLAISRHRQDLSPEIVDVLTQLEPDDLIAARQLDRKLSGLDGILADNNNGIIGM